jgi:peroxiredoxin
MPLKNISKSIFISFFVMLIAFGAVYFVWQIRATGFSLILVGAMLAYGAPFVYFVRIFVMKRPRNARHQMGYSLTIVAGIMVFLYGIVSAKNFPGLFNLILLAILPIGWWLYVYVYSVFGRKKVEVLKPGNLMPELFFEDVAERPVSSKSFQGHYSVLIFYRGNWCPFCMAQVQEMAKYYQALKSLNTEVYLISPQKLAYTQNLARKFKVDMHFLRDAGNKAASRLGISHENGTPVGFDILGYERDTVMPTVVILDLEGKVIYADETDNYRIRPEPDEFLRIIRQDTQKG